MVTRWTQALIVVLMTLPRTLIDLGPFIRPARWDRRTGTVVEKRGINRHTHHGMSIFNIAMVMLSGGLILIVALSAIDEWIASPMQQQALQIKTHSNHDTSRKHSVGPPWQ